MALMAGMLVLLVAGVIATFWWSGVRYQTWGAFVPEGGDREERPADESASQPLGRAVQRYLRGVAIALVGGFWAGALVTGPAVRLIMRLLAVTAGDAAQGKVTEAEEVVGNIDFEGTIGLYLFGGVLPGLMSGAIYVVIRRWLPGGRLGGVAFGALHLVVAATRIDPLRPDNPDFDLVGPGWLAVSTFGAAAILHGMAVVAIANRYSRALPPAADAPRRRLIVFAPLALPALLLVPGAFLLVPLTLALVVTVCLLTVNGAPRVARSRGVLLAGRVTIAALALVLLPGALRDLRDVAVRDEQSAHRVGERVVMDSPPTAAAVVLPHAAGPVDGLDRGRITRREVASDG